MKLTLLDLSEAKAAQQRRGSMLSDTPRGERMVSGVWPGGRGAPPKREARQAAETFMTHPWVRANVGKVASVYASIEWRLAAPKKAGKFVKDTRYTRPQPLPNRTKLIEAALASGDLQEITDHPALDVLNRPTPGYFVGLTARKLKYIYRTLCGESFEIIDRKRIRGASGLGVPSALWPIPPHWVQSTPTPKHPFFRFSYGGFNEDIPAQDVYWSLQHPDTSNPYDRGSGIARAMADELDADEEAARLQTFAFYNRGRPDIVVSLNGADADEVDAARDEWNQKTRGVENYLRAFFTNMDAKVTPLTQSFKELELLNLRKFGRDAFRMILGMPPEIIGDIENSNRSTIEAADYLLMDKVIVPELEYEREFRQETFIPEFDDRLILYYINPVQEDAELQKTIMTALPAAFHVDEIRKRAGEPPLPDGQGKLHLITFSQKAVRDLSDLEDAEQPAPAPFGGGAPAGGDDPAPGDKPAAQDAKPDAQATPADEGKGRRPPTRKNLRTDEHWTGLVAKLFAPGEASYLRAYRTFSRSLEADQVRRILGATSDCTTSALLFPALVWREAAKEYMRPTYRRIFDLSAEQMAAELDRKGAAASAYVKATRRGVLAHLNTVVGRTVDTTRDRLRDVIDEARGAGLTLEETAAQVQAKFDDWEEGGRYDSIARDQTSSTVSGAREVVMEDAGVEMGEWLDAGDERVREHHLILGSTQPMPIGFNYAEFLGGGFVLRRPHDPDCDELSEIVNCRCVIVPAA